MAHTAINLASEEGKRTALMHSTELRMGSSKYKGGWGGRGLSGTEGV